MTVNDELPWIEVARRYIGLAEIPGKQTAPTIARWLRELRAWWTDDEAPWCGVFTGACLRESGMSYPKHWYRARAYLEWGDFLPAARYGAVVVYERGGGGHVGFVVGIDGRGNILTLGGNQGNRVSVAPFATHRVLGYRWPRRADGAVMPIQWQRPLPVLASLNPVSNNEA